MLKQIFKNILFFSSFSLLLLQFGCKHEPLKLERQICFESEVLPIFIANCSQTGCHGGGSSKGGYTLDSYSGIMKGIKAWEANESKNYKQIIEGKMPPAPNPKLTTEQKKLIEEWINGGALNSINCDTLIACDTSSVLYSTTISSIMSKYCVGCHNLNSTQGGVRLDGYVNVKYQADQGKLLGSINWGNGYPKMPPNTNKISECEINQIKIWIANGTPNN